MISYWHVVQMLATARLCCKFSDFSPISVVFFASMPLKIHNNVWCIDHILHNLMMIFMIFSKERECLTVKVFSLTLN